MPIAEDSLTKALGKYYRDRGFRLFEENDHTLVLEHTPCHFQDRFSTTADKLQMDAIRNDCEDHLKRCEFCGEPKGV